MAYAMKCDRCGKYYDECLFSIVSQKGHTIEDDMANKIVVTYNERARHKYDLCSDCIGELMSWFGLKNIGSTDGVIKYVDKEGADGEEG